MASTDLLTTSTAPPAATTSTDINLPINLFTRNAQHTIPASTYLLPSSWRRFQLSSLINKVLGPDQPIPFDFIIDGELLRGSLESFVKQRRGGDLESTLNVEYVESLMPPKEQGTFPQDDWVSGVSIARPG
jgi:ribosome biogenesis protein YTM1